MSLALPAISPPAVFPAIQISNKDEIYLRTDRGS